MLRIMFIEPGETPTPCVHDVLCNDALAIDVRLFCEDVIRAVEKWLEDMEGSDMFKKNYDKCVRRYPEGLPGYMEGPPVIA